ncbi:hypothetical protein ABIJ98_000947 [Listeria monocytogenes]|uniref:hypothetical protein n=1 Tax=Listeria monocytogenes TaxID=1639 RepID=UPI00117C1DCA|nr:hypothetical protein [Listeria monocytogenes]EAG0857761.1 hypothetical protein [Listeria monocytogenes]EHX2087931.1 hypothetical protein [Listeria monocytogenes]EIT9567548.1 hypothetical protein [Listeria monocytogenes]
MAATVIYTKVANYVSTWHIKSLGGLHWTDDGVYIIKANNEPAFCIEPGVMLNEGSGSTPSEMTSNEREKLSLIAYYGYQVNPIVEIMELLKVLFGKNTGTNFYPLSYQTMRTAKRR